MRSFVFIIVSCIICFSFASGQDAKELTLEEIFQPGSFELENLNNPQWLPDGNAFVFEKFDSVTGITSLYRHDVQSGIESLWIDGMDFQEPDSGYVIDFSDYSISGSGAKIMLKSNARRVWRDYDLANYFIYDIDKKQALPVRGDGNRIMHPKLSPDETMVGYVFENNIYVTDLKNKKTARITNDGSEIILNGRADWVYEEEFGIADCWRWSPDGKKIAFWRFDQSPVPTFSWTEFSPANGRVRTIHYPKAGDPNSLVKIGVYHLDKEKTVWMDIGSETDIYIPRIQWTNDPDLLSIQRMNRLQNNLELLLADGADGTSAVILSDTDPCWVDVDDDLFFLDKKPQFLWTSEQDGFNHIYLYDLKGKLIRQITNCEWVVKQIYDVDENRGQVYFSANKGDVLSTKIFKAALDHSEISTLTIKAGSHSADFSPRFKHFIHSYSAIETPRQINLLNNEGKTVRNLVKTSTDQFDETGMIYPEFLKFKTGDGVELNAQIIKPADFDPDKKYPVLIYGYGGPGSQVVRNSWGRGSSKLWYTLLTQKGYIIFSLDNRGTGGRGKAFKNLAYRDIGKYAVGDHIEGAKYLATLPYVDKARIGIWGWSGGGYLTLLAMTKGAEHFKAGIAVAPVSDFRLYDTIWSERYMGLPSDNAAGYDSASVLSYVDDYREGLLVVHGMSDDNVHAQNTMQFASLMQYKNKQFSLMVYPGKNHSLQGKNVHLHLYTMMTEFILENL